MSEEDMASSPAEQDKASPAEKPDTVVSKAEAAAERLEAANARHEELIKREEALRVEDMLGGQSETENVQREESPAEYVERLERGEYKDGEFQ